MVLLFPKPLERIRPCQLEMERSQMMQVDSLKKGKGEGQRQTPKPERKSHDQHDDTSFTDINTCKNCGKPGHWATGWRPGGGAYDNSKQQHTERQEPQGKGKSKHVDVGEPNQLCETASTAASTESSPSQTPSTIGELSCTSNVEPWIMGVTINSVSTGRQAGAEYLLLDSGAQLHACPIKHPGQKVPLPDPGLHSASGARLQHDGGRLVGQFECFSTRVQFRDQFCPLVVSLSRGTGVIFAQTLVHCSFLTRPRRNVATQGREIVLCQRDDGCAVVDRWSE